MFDRYSIHTHRLMRGMSEHELSEASGIEPARLYALQYQDAYPKNDELDALAEVFNQKRFWTGHHWKNWPELFGDDLKPVEERFGPFPQIDTATERDRDALIMWIEAVARAAKYAVLHPRNVKKGGWRNDGPVRIRRRQIEETLEFQDALGSHDFPHAVTEAGDILAFIAMELDAQIYLATQTKEQREKERMGTDE